MPTMLESAGFVNVRKIHRNLPVAQLIEMAVQRGEGQLAANGALNTITAPKTGRSPNDKYVVEEPSTKDRIWWDKNRRLSPERFDTLLNKARAYLQDKDVFVFDGYAGADPENRIAVRVISERAWHSLFAQTLFLRPTQQQLEVHTPEYTVINVCGMEGIPSLDGLRSECFIVISFEKRMVLIGGTHYAGEIKKSIFTVMNYILPLKGILSMHCSSNIGRGGDTAVFFGLSGTGKTTLSADPNRRLIGDDEHGWSESGIFNVEGGCYAKTIKLSKEGEPQIWNAIRYGSVLENVVLNDRREPLFDSDSITENTRATYPVEFIDNCVIPGIGGHPRNIVFLTADAFGVLPPISKLTHEQAMYHFLLGYTSKVAGTETGITEPTATFSTCFAAPFLPLHPTVYADLLGKKLKKHNSNVWLVNTGWTGGPYGVGHRMKLQHTRAMLYYALSGLLDDLWYNPDPVFGLMVPQSCHEVPASLLLPRNTWQDKAAYDHKARELAAMFAKNFEQYSGMVNQEVAAAGPRI